MKPVAIKKDIYWVGAVDFNKRNFHGYSRSPRGTTYNAFAILDKKNVVFDTVDIDYESTMLCRLAHLLPLEKIDYIVINHAEKDHSGALAELIPRCKPEKIFVSAVGKKFLQAQFDTKGWPLEVVKTGDTVNIGSRTIEFIETRMLHWPDSMASYIPEDKLLISNDAFGQNIASTERFSDQYDHSTLMKSVKEYYNNIILPFSPQVLKVLETFHTMKLDIDMIAPDHGLIWRGKEDVAAILDAYKSLAEQKPLQRAIIAYSTMWHSTCAMAQAIGAGLDDENVPYRLLDLADNHHSVIMTELADCGAVLLGSPTHNNTMLPQLAAALSYMKGLRPQNKIAAAFGSYGWSGEGPKHIHEALQGMGLDTPCEPLRIPFVPNHEGLQECYNFGVAVAKALKEKIAQCQA